MRMKLQATAISLLAAAAIAPAFADSLVPQVGGTGGVQYNERCPEGQVLNGFELRAGDDIDAIRAVCTTPTSLAGSTAPPLSNGFGAGWHGGPGGSLQRVLCPPGTPVVVGVYLFADGRDTISLDQIAIYCGTVSPAWTSDSRYPSNLFFAPIQPDLCPPSWFSSCVMGTGPLVLDPQYCPHKTIAIGMYGRSGNLVDAMGLICGPAPTFGPPPPPPVAAMGHAGPKKTPLQHALENAGMLHSRPAAANTAINDRATQRPQASNRAAGLQVSGQPATGADRVGLNPQPLPPGKQPGIKLSHDAATDAANHGIIIVGGKPQESRTAMPTVYQRLEDGADGDD